MKSNKILIIGSSGYIGSALYQHLSSNYSVDGCDRVAADLPCKFVKDYDNLNALELMQYDTIILLAGNSSVTSCAGDFNNCFNNNVVKFQTLLYKLDGIQSTSKHKFKVIYASSSSVYGRGTYNCQETDQLPTPMNNYDTTKQICDLIAERHMNNIEIYGLRFGTVNGSSPKMRWDLMVNSMFKSARENGYIEISNNNIHRPILAMHDLISGIEKILEYENDKDQGIYNLCSFNSTVEEIAADVQFALQQLMPKLEIKEKSSNQSYLPYDFSIDNTYFRNVFQWQPKGRPLGPPIYQLILDLIAHQYEFQRT